VSWVSWQRPEDYYDEGLLIWLDADTKNPRNERPHEIVDDFAKLFFGVDNGSFVPHTYIFDDVVAALNEVQPTIGPRSCHTRVDQLAPHTPEDGFTRGGLPPDV